MEDEPTGTSPPPADEAGILTQAFDEMAAGLREGEWTKNAFDRYIDEQVRDLLLRGGIRLGGEEMEATVLVAKLHHFSSLVQGKSPLETADFLNRYFARVVPSISSHSGRVDQYVSWLPAVVAIFGAPTPQPEQRSEAMAAALEISQVMKAASLPFTLTINNGPVSVGNIGTEDKLQYTVVGEMVYRALRMSDRQKPYTIVVMGRRFEQDYQVLNQIQKRPDLLSIQPLGSNLRPAYQIDV